MQSNASEEQIVKWVNAIQMDSQFVWTSAAINTIPVVKTDPRIPTALMLFYLRRQVPISVEWQQRFVELMTAAFKSGHVATGIINRKPVWFYILQHRWAQLYPLLRLPAQPILAGSIQLAGFFGALVKSALNVQVNQQSVADVVKFRQAHHDFRSILYKLSQNSTSQVSIALLMDAINDEPFPPLREIDIRTPYQIGIHPKLPKLGRFLIHEAILNGHKNLFQAIYAHHPKALMQKDNWSRTPLHLMAVLNQMDEASSLSVSEMIQNMKDGFGRTAADIQTWKESLVQTASPASLSSDNGGWDSSLLERHRGSKQEIDIVDYSELPWAQFQKQYAACGKPVLIRGVPNVEVLKRKWTRASFERRFAKLPVEIGDIPYAKSLGREGRITSFEQYRESTGNYAFVQLHPKQHAELLNDIPQLGYLSKLVGVHTQFYQGVAGTGAPMHLHIDAWNCLVYGEKRWFLMPPFKGVYSALTAMEWVDSQLSSISAIECVQKEGDVLYVPKYWSHAVLNTKESIGIAREFINPYLA